MLPAAVSVLVATAFAGLSLDRVHSQQCDFKFTDTATSLIRASVSSRHLQTVRITFPANLATVIQCFPDESASRLKFSLKYRVKQGNGGEWQNYDMDTVAHSGQFDLHVDDFRPCDIIELRMRAKLGRNKDNLKLDDVQLGPRSPMANIRISDVKGDSARLSWSPNGQECATAFRFTSESFGSIDIPNLNTTHFDLSSSLQPCTDYRLEVAPLMGDLIGSGQPVKFSTFPAGSMFMVEVHEDHVSFSEDNLISCHALLSIKYQADLAHEDRPEFTVSVEVLGVRHHFDMVSGTSHKVSLDQLRTELITHVMMKPCATYRMNLSAEVSSDDESVSKVLLVRDLQLQADENRNIHFGDQTLCDNMATISQDLDDEEVSSTDLSSTADVEAPDDLASVNETASVNTRSEYRLLTDQLDSMSVISSNNHTPVIVGSTIFGIIVLIGIALIIFGAVQRRRQEAEYPAQEVSSLNKDNMTEQSCFVTKASPADDV